MTGVDDVVSGKLRNQEVDLIYVAMLFVAGCSLILSGSKAVNPGWILCWCGVGFILVGLAYTRFGAGVFGKRLDGDRSWLNRIVLFPYLILIVVMWHLRHRVLSREETCNQVSPGIWLGRRPLDGELPSGITTVVDLTAEFSATPQARKLKYMCVPTLDGCAPQDEDFYKLINALSLSREAVYIHCAAGHGRSAAVAVALLVARGLANDLNEAEGIVKNARPRISLSKPQRELLNRWFKNWHQANA